MTDYIIVGSGPSGLTLAWLLAKVGKRCVIVEAGPQIGGCHSVNRQNGKFSEHGPRIYSSSYSTFSRMLGDMGSSFQELFVPYKFIPGLIGTNTVKQLSLYEIGQLTLGYMASILFNYKNTSMSDYTANFTPAARFYLDSLCRLTDGAALNNYSVHKFMQLINQQILHDIYQPALPNDEGLFKVWKNELTNLGVEIHTNTKVTSLITGGVQTTVGRIYGKNVVLALPPQSIQKINNNCTPMDSTWLKNNTYIDYITINYEWNNRLDLPDIWGFTSTPWGVVYVIMSDYFKNYKDKTLISVGITKVDSPNNAGQIARYTDNETVKREALRQLRETYPNLPDPDSAVIGSHIGDQTAYIEGIGLDKLQKPYPFSSETPHIYNVGTHNGKSPYVFTSLESAVANAHALAHDLEPETQIYPISQAWTLNWIILIIILVVGFLLTKNIISDTCSSQGKKYN
jgi:hypothetical protein